MADEPRKPAVGSTQTRTTIPAEEIAETERHRAFMQGEPLSEEHAALRDEKKGKGQHEVKPLRPGVENAARELTLGERAALREFRLSDAWPVFLRIQEKLSQMHRAGAISKSQIDPLANAQQIAEEWAYYALFRRACRELETYISAEVEREEER